jgi:hypothetical protein
MRGFLTFFEMRLARVGAVTGVFSFEGALWRRFREKI